MPALCGSIGINGLRGENRRDLRIVVCDSTEACD
jgi:hypothetical protein